VKLPDLDEVCEGDMHHMVERGSSILWTKGGRVITPVILLFSRLLPRLESKSEWYCLLAVLRIAWLDACHTTFG
jgi:hypothetical protein